MLNRCLVEATGWIGDSLFALSLPKKLKEELKFDIVDFVIYRPQPLLIIKNNKYINNVFLERSPEKYDKVFTLPSIDDKSILPTIQFQNFCGIKNYSTGFEVDTPKEVDTYTSFILQSTKKNKKDIITYQGDWDYRLWSPTEEEIKTKTWNKEGLYPYYKSLRPVDFNYFINKIKSAFPHKLFLEISPFGINNIDPRGYCVDPIRYTFQASIIKQSTIFLGAEGGLTNLSSGMGVKTIYTTCHMSRMFGKNGVISSCDDVQLGPCKLFPDKGHVAIDPYLSTEDTIAEIIRSIKNNENNT